jgi:hypothetical protein
MTKRRTLAHKLSRSINKRLMTLINIFHNCPRVVSAKKYRMMKTWFVMDARLEKSFRLQEVLNQQRQSSQPSRWLNGFVPAYVYLDLQDHCQRLQKHINTLHRKLDAHGETPLLAAARTVLFTSRRRLRMDARKGPIHDDSPTPEHVARGGERA